MATLLSEKTVPSEVMKAILELSEELKQALRMRVVALTSVPAACIA